MITIKKVTLLICIVILPHLDLFSQVTITDKDSLINFICGDWLLTQSGYWKGCDFANGLGNIGCSNKLSFSKLNEKLDSISCTLYFNDSICRIVNYKLTYEHPTFSNNLFKKEWIFYSKAKNGLLHLMTVLKIFNKDSLSFGEVCYKGCYGHFVRINRQ